jgi:hypothetical protein
MTVEDKGYNMLIKGKAISTRVVLEEAPVGLCRSFGYGFLSTVCTVYLEVGLGSGSIALCQDAIDENTL